jgi:predicted ester cyclase
MDEPAGATAADREAQLRRFFTRVWNERRYEEANRLYGSSYTNPHAPGLTGAEAKCVHIRKWHESFPDIRVQVEHVVASDNEVAVHVVMEGTDTGGWQGRPPTGRRVRVWVFQMDRFDGEHVIEEWIGGDYLGLFEQLGVVASPWQTADPRSPRHRIGAVARAFMRRRRRMDTPPVQHSHK